MQITDFGTEFIFYFSFPIYIRKYTNFMHCYAEFQEENIFCQSDQKKPPYDTYVVVLGLKLWTFPLHQKNLDVNESVVFRL